MTHGFASFGKETPTDLFHTPKVIQIFYVGIIIYKSPTNARPYLGGTIPRFRMYLMAKLLKILP